MSVVTESVPGSSATRPRGAPDAGRSPEGELLLLCARTRLRPSQHEHMATLLARELDWRELGRLSRRHRLGPLLLRHLAPFSGRGVPPQVLGALRGELALNAARGRILADTLGQILRLLGSNGIDAIPYKGPVLAEQLYGDTAFRLMTDLDVLVRREDVARALELLQGLGYHSPYHRTPRQLQALLQADNNYPLQAEAPRPSLELHWAFAARHPIREMDLEALLASARTVQRAEFSIPTLSSEDLLLVLCFHGMRHMWERLSWLCDVAEILRQEAIDWARLLHRAERYGARRALLLGLYLANRELDAPVSEPFLELTASDPAVPGLARESMALAFAPQDHPANSLGMRYHRFQLAAMDRLRERAGYLFHAALVPTAEDWAAVPLPDSLFPLYGPMRPFRLAATYAARLLGRPRT